MLRKKASNSAISNAERWFLESKIAKSFMFRKKEANSSITKPAMKVILFYTTWFGRQGWPVLLVFSVTPFKTDQNKKSKSFNRLSPESGNKKKVDMRRLSPRFRSQQFFLWKICGETFFPNL